MEAMYLGIEVKTETTTYIRLGSWKIVQIFMYDFFSVSFIDGGVDTVFQVLVL